MAAELIIEDGTGVEDANSYVDRQTVVDYCALRGLTVAAAPVAPTVDPLLPYIVTATDYLESYAERYIGRQEYQDGLQWPRIAVFGTYIFHSDRLNPYLVGGVIPKPLQKAQCQLVVEQLKGNSIFASASASGSSITLASPVVDSSGNEVDIEAADGRFIKRERLEGVADIEYSELIGTGVTAYLPQVDNLLSSLLVNGGSIQVAVTRG